MSPDKAKFGALLGKVFDDARQGLRKEVGQAEYKRRRDDFVFHMTDWLHDLEGLWSLSQQPEAFDIDRATTMVIGSLYHMIPHIKAAGRLLLDEVPDAFADDWAAKAAKPPAPVEPPRQPRTAAQ
ncbi:MAG: hypothetical protein K2R98_11910 [Gemmataceae bacterium]|nr:hypothetical protein [Gemmataceae bacterium]